MPLCGFGLWMESPWFPIGVQIQPCPMFSYHCYYRLAGMRLAFSCFTSGFDSDSAFGGKVNGSSSWALAFWAELKNRDWDVLVWHLWVWNMLAQIAAHWGEWALRDPTIVTAIDLCVMVLIWPFRAFPYRKVWERKRQIVLESLSSE